MSDNILNIKSFDILVVHTNQDVIDSVEKVWTKTNVTKEVKERQIYDVFHMFVGKMNKLLFNGDWVELADLVLEKSVYISKTTELKEWPNAENLKLNDLHRLALPLYSYLKYHNAQTNKHNRDVIFKGFENLIKLINILIESLNTYGITDDLLFFLFNELFDFYAKARSCSTMTEENKEKVFEDMEATIQFIYEETNIANLAKMKGIESNASKTFVVGLLGLILNYKVNKYENNNEAISSDLVSLDNCYNHLDILKENSPIIYLEYTLVRNVHHLIYDEIVNFELLTSLIDSFKFYKIYRKFRKK